MQQLTAARRSGWQDWWRRGAPALRRSGVWPTRASLGVERARLWWNSRQGTAPRYSRLLELGSGRQSSVCAALASSADGVYQLVVLKGLPGELAGDAEAAQRLLDEARLTARMNHPNVVAMQGLLRERTGPVLVLEYLPGPSLATLIASANDLREFSLELRIGIVARLLRGLDHVHRLRDLDGRPLRVVHGALSPENVVVTCEGEVKLIDFGAARLRAAIEDPLARRRLPYAPPEQFSGAPDLRGDIFSAGVILWELVANRPLWGRVPAPTLVRRLLAGEIPRLREVVPSVDGELDRICARALAPHPDGRFRSAAELRGELEHYLSVRGALVTDSAIGALVGSACRELQRAAQRTIDARIGELGLKMPSARPPARATKPGSAALERNQRTIAASIVAAAILIAILLTATHRRAPLPVTSPAAGPAATHSGAPRPDAFAQGQDAVVGDETARLVRIDLRVRPAHARLFIDGRRLSSNPLQATMAWDPQLHTVRGEADGYEPFTITFRLDADVTIDAELRRKPAGAALESRSTSAPTRMAMQPRGERHARRRLD